jgi:hypothetical protein
MPAAHRAQNSLEIKKPPQPRGWQTIRGWLLVWSPKIGFVTRNMKPVAEKTQSTAGEAPATLSGPAIDLSSSSGGQFDLAAGRAG